MPIESISAWLSAHALISLIVLLFVFIFVGFTVVILRSFGNIKALLAAEKIQQNEQQTLQYATLQVQIDNDNQMVRNQLGKLSESLAIRTQHLEKQSQQQYQLSRQDNELTKDTFSKALGQLQESLHQQQHHIQESSGQNFIALQRVIAEQLKNQTEQVRHNVDTLNKTTESRLKDIAGRVNQQLEQGFHKTNNTFTDIQKRLSVIDEAQKRIDHLSTHVMSLQNVLTDKKTRGTFGEMQLKTIVENALPTQFVSFQYPLSNNKRPDCIIHLPEPNGDMVIDAKFPLESYRQLADSEQQSTATISQIFKKDIRKHITDIASKYILPPETAESAIMFIPAEAIFAEIHAHHLDLVEFAQRHQVWLTSPTTLMAVLMTAKSVIKDDATRQQAHIMREQLVRLRGDFERFQSRMGNLAKHIDQAHKDVGEVNTSANKISKHFQQIEASEEWEKHKKVSNNEDKPKDD